MLDSHLHWKVKLSFISFLELLRFGGDLLSLSLFCASSLREGFGEDGMF